LASETELFIGQLLEGRTTPAFGQGHLEYLRQEEARAGNELREARVDKNMTRQLEICRNQMAALASLLAGLENRTEDKSRLFASRRQAATIRLVLEQASGQL
jgi:hypothetical protein